MIVELFGEYIFVNMLQFCLLCVVMRLSCLIDDNFPFRECVENVINYFSWARGSPYFKQSSIEFSAES